MFSPESQRKNRNIVNGPRLDNRLRNTRRNLVEVRSRDQVLGIGGVRIAGMQRDVAARRADAKAIRAALIPTA